MVVFIMLEFDFGLGEDIDLLRETVRSFAADKIAPRAIDIDASNEFPLDLWPEVGELGLLGITVGEEYGGSNLGYLAHVVAMEEISSAVESVMHEASKQSKSLIAIDKNSRTEYVRNLYHSHT